MPPLPSWEGDELGWHDGVDYRDRYCGCLLGGAAGDALGRPAEGLAAEEVARRFGRLSEFRRWGGWESGPVGTVTDDTQLTMLVGGSLVACRRVDPEDLAGRLVGWLPEGRGMGKATRRAVGSLAGGAGWSEAGEDSDGNGAAIRVAPVGLACATDPDRLRRSVALSSLPTHAGRTRIVGTVAQAYAVARLVHTPAGGLDPGAFLVGAVGVLADLDDPGVVERRPGGRRVHLAELLGALAAVAGYPPAEVFAELHNGALITESLPAAWWCFLASPDDPERVIETAVSGGRDADTVAAMAGALAGGRTTASRRCRPAGSTTWSTPGSCEPWPTDCSPSPGRRRAGRGCDRQTGRRKAAGGGGRLLVWVAAAVAAGAGGRRVPSRVLRPDVA